MVLFMVFGVVAFAQDAEPAPEKVFRPKIKRTAISPYQSVIIDPVINEGSGLCAWNGQLWTHNDSGIAKLFAIDTTSGKITTEYPLPLTMNNDWEDMSQDSLYFYIGDFGNNAGTREKLHIIRIDKASLLVQKPVIDTIAFQWPETITSGQRAKINFDCEAMAVINDSIYLFTKEWRSGRRTRAFSLPAQPGSYTAKYKATLKTRIIITGASYHTAGNKLVLCGYNLQLRPFLLEFTINNTETLFEGKMNRIKIRKRFRQTEGVTTFDGKNYYVINEDFRFLFLHTRQELHNIRLKP